MSYEFEDINSGDLITSNFMTSIINAIKSLDDRVIKLETSEPDDNRIEIVELDPESDSYRLDQILTVIGKNFEYLIGGLRVYVGEVNVIRYIEASDTKVVFKIPSNISNILEGGSEVHLIVSNRSSTDSKMIILKPKIELLTGFIDLVYQSVDPITFYENDQVDFMYTLTPHISKPANFIITPSISEATNQIDWESEIEVLVPDENGNLVETNQILLEKIGSKNIYIRISSVPPGTDGTSFKLTTAVSFGDKTFGADNRNFEVGMASEQEDTTFNLEFGYTDPQNIISADLSTISLQAGTTGTIHLTASKFTFPGDYYNSWLTPPAGWEISRFVETPVFHQVNQANLSVARDVAFELSPAEGSQYGEVEFIIQRNGETRKRRKIYNLKLIS